MKKNIKQLVVTYQHYKTNHNLRDYFYMHFKPIYNGLTFSGEKNIVHYYIVTYMYDISIDYGGIDAVSSVYLD